MKVLFTASTYSHFVNFHRPYLQWFRARGWTVHAACGGSPLEVPGADEIIFLPFEKKMSSPRNFKAARLLRERIRREKYDAVITHTSLAAFFTRLAVKGMRDRPVMINMVHGYLMHDGSSALKRNILLAAERLTAAETDLLLVMNQWDLDLARRYRLGREIRFVPGIGLDPARLTLPDADAGAELRARLGIPADAFVLVYPAEFSGRKSQMLLLRGMELLPENVYLLLPGDGAALEECRAYAGAHGLAERVVFPGYIRDMAPWYAAADASVSASRSEGLPFNIMEAMYMGLPVIASAVKGHTDLLRDGGSGLLYPYGDAEAFAERVRTLLDTPELRRALGEHARAAVTPFTLEQVFPQVTACYASYCPVPVG